MGDEVETGAQRLRHHLRRPHHPERYLTDAKIGSTVKRTDPIRLGNRLDGARAMGPWSLRSACLPAWLVSMCLLDLAGHDVVRLAESRAGKALLSAADVPAPSPLGAPAGPLAGVRVLELAGLGPAPFAAMMLADMGADVITVARPGPTMQGPPILNRGKRSIILDLGTPDGRTALLALADRADVLIEGYRPGVVERLGIGPENCWVTNPKLVYGRMTGWGQDGPRAHEAGHDIGYIGLTGALHAIGPRDGPPTPPLALAGDFGGGGMFLLAGVLAALLEARSSGLGQVGKALLRPPVRGPRMYCRSASGYLIPSHTRPV